MNRKTICLLLLCFIAQYSFAQFNHRYLVGGVGMKEIRIIDRNGEVEWSYPTMGICCDLWQLSNGNTVITNWGGHGHKGEQAQIIEISPDKKIVGKVFKYELVNEPSAIQVLDVKGSPEKGEVYK